MGAQRARGAVRPTKAVLGLFSAAALGLGLSACGSAAPEPEPSQTNEQTAPEVSPEPELTPEEEAQAAVDALDWQRVEILPAGFSFEIPADWSLEEGEYGPAIAPQYTLLDDTGEERLMFAGAMGGFGSPPCVDVPLSPVEILVNEQVDLPGIGTRSFQLVTLESDAGLTATIGLQQTETKAAEYAPTCVVQSVIDMPEVPEVSGEGFMPQGYFSTDWMIGTGDIAEGAGMAFDSAEEVLDFTASEAFLTVKRVITSLEFSG